MKLTDFDKNTYASKALAENYQMAFDVSNLDKIKTQKMLLKVQRLMKEARDSSEFKTNQVNPSYMKLVFMEEALSSHYSHIMSRPQTRIVIENEEVEKSQVVLAAQDMVDSIQKMLEDVGQMQVKELPALVDSIESEIGVNESQAYNDTVSSQLDTLSGALKAAFAAMKSARDTLTGQGGSFTEPEPAAEVGADLGAEAGAEMGAELGAEAGAAPEMEEPTVPEEPDVATSTVGRAKR